VKILAAFASLLLLAVSCATTGAVKPYPLDTCIVTDNALDSMGPPITLVHEGQEVKFCCKPCVGKFRKDPAKYLSKLAPKAP
jgi:hypothetical protein